MMRNLSGILLRARKALEFSHGLDPEPTSPTTRTRARREEKRREEKRREEKRREEKRREEKRREEETANPASRSKLHHVKKQTFAGGPHGSPCLGCMVC